MNRRVHLPVAAAGLLMALVASSALPAEAIATRHWTGNNDNWVFSEPTNWDGNTPIANGDLLTFKGIHEDTLRNDIVGLSLTRLTFEDGFFTIIGDPIQVDDIVANENGGFNTINVNLTGIGRTLVGKGSVLGLGGANTFTGQVDIAGGLIANSDKALGSPTGTTRILAGGSLEFGGRDLGIEPIRIETEPGPLTDRGCSIYNSGGASFLRDVRAFGAFCIVNAGAITYPAGIKEDFEPYEAYLLSGTHIFGGATAATGTIHIGGEGTLIWNATSPVQLSNLGLGDTVAKGTLIGTGSAASVDINGGTFRPGDDPAPGIFTVTGPLKMQHSSFEALLMGTAAGTGYSQAKVTGPVTIGLETTLDLTLGFTPGTGQSFRIIDNTGAQPISGSFKGLPEGQTFAFGGKSWNITYKGGTGNDVVITTQASDPRPFKRILLMLAAGN